MPRSGWLALGGALAAALTVQGDPAPTVLLVAGAGFLVAAAAAGLVRSRWLAAALAGAGVIALRCAVEMPSPAVELPAAREWTAEVTEVRAPADGRQRVVLDAAPAGGGVAQVRLWATLPRYPILAPGDRIAFSAEAEAPPPQGGFGDYLRRSRIAGTVLVRDVAPAGSDRSPIEAVRRASGDAIAAVLPEPQAGLAAGIVVGLRERVDRSLADAFATSGLSHVVAISGWNIALVAACLASVLRRLGRRPRSIVLVAAVAAYTLFAGASASVVRAAVMAGVVVVARESGRRGAAGTALGIAAFSMLVVHPATVGDVGYQLSVAATAGLLAWASGVSAWIRCRIPRAPASLAETLGVSLAAQLATLPIVLLAFGRISLVAPLANLVAAPLVAPAMLVGVLALVAGVLVDAGVPSVAALPVSTAGWAAFGALAATGHAAARLPLASVELTEPWNAVAAAIAALVIAAAAWCAHRPRRRHARARGRA